MQSESTLIFIRNKCPHFANTDVLQVLLNTQLTNKNNLLKFCFSVLNLPYFYFSFDKIVPLNPLIHQAHFQSHISFIIIPPYPPLCQFSFIGFITLHFSYVLNFNRAFLWFLACQFSPEIKRAFLKKELPDSQMRKNQVIRLLKRERLKFQFIQLLYWGWDQGAHCHYNTTIHRAKRRKWRERMVSKYFNLMVAAGTSEGSANNYGVLPYVFAFLSSIIWPLAWIYSNQQSVNMAETTMIRGITSLVANYVICKMSDSDITFKNGSTFKYILIRSLILSTTSLFVGVSQFILPLSIVHTIISSATLFVFVIDYAINSVMVNLKQAVGIAIGMIGMVLASNGRFISTLIDPDYEEHSRFQNYITDNIYITALFTFAFIVVIFFTSYAFVLTKHLKCNPFQINYFLGFTNLFSGALILQFIPNSYQPRSIITQYDPIVFYKAIIFTGIPLLFDQWFLMAALTMTKESGIVSMISCTSIIIGYLVSVFRYGERPNLFINVGIGLLVLGMYQTLFNINKQQQDEEVESVSGQDNEDGTFKSGIHRNLHKGPIGEPSASTNNAGQQQSQSKNLAVNSKEKSKDDQDRLILRHEVSLSD